MFEGMPKFIKPKNIAKAVTAASVFAITAGEMSNPPRAFAEEEGGKTTTQQIIKNDSKSESDFFNIIKPEKSVKGFTVETGRIGSVDNNENAAEEVRTGNIINNSASENPEEQVNENIFYKTNASGGVTTGNIGGVR